MLKHVHRKNLLIFLFFYVYFCFILYFLISIHISHSRTELRIRWFGCSGLRSGRDGHFLFYVLHHLQKRSCKIWLRVFKFFGFFARAFIPSFTIALASAGQLWIHMSHIVLNGYLCLFFSSNFSFFSIFNIFLLPFVHAAVFPADWQINSLSSPKIDSVCCLSRIHCLSFLLWFLARNSKLCTWIIVLKFILRHVCWSCRILFWWWFSVDIVSLFTHQAYNVGKEFSENHHEVLPLNKCRISECPLMDQEPCEANEWTVRICQQKVIVIYPYCIPLFISFYFLFKSWGVIATA